MKNEKIVYILHCVDAEGPCAETPEATFERLYEIFDIRMVPSAENLKKIQNREIDFGERTGLIAEVFDTHNLNYNDTWEKIDAMLLKIMSIEFRRRLLDSFGNGWVYNWHCVDYVGYLHNPRRRDTGVHKIFDHYKRIIDKTGSYQDGVHWHFHPMSVYREAHRCATSYINSPNLYEILCRRIIEREWFPVVSRAGFHVERPDSHWFLEQWIPFDASNISYKRKDAGQDEQLDLAEGRLDDWRLAPADWSVYHPNHDNYQIPGNCRRLICRTLGIRVRNKVLAQDEVDSAFARADQGLPTIMGITDHDFRDMAREVEDVRGMIIKASGRFPDVKFKFCEAREAFRLAVYGQDATPEPLELKVSLEKSQKASILRVETVKGRVFGPQPFLAVKTRDGRFIHDNFDFDTTLTRWSYVFDLNSIHADDVEAIGLAANDKYGNTFIEVIR